MRIEAARAEETVATGARAARATDLQRRVTLHTATLASRSELVGVERYLQRAEGVRKRMSCSGRTAGDVGGQATPLEVDVGLPGVAQEPRGDLGALVELSAHEGVRGPQRLPRPVVGVAAAVDVGLQTSTGLRVRLRLRCRHEAPATGAPWMRMSASRMLPAFARPTQAEDEKRAARNRMMSGGAHNESSKTRATSMTERARRA